MFLTIVYLLLIILLLLISWLLHRRPKLGAAEDNIPDYLIYHFKMINYQPFPVPKSIVRHAPIILPCYYDPDHDATLDLDDYSYIAYDLGYYYDNSIHIYKIKNWCDPIARIDNIIGTSASNYFDYMALRGSGYLYLFLKILGNYDLYNKILAQIRTLKQHIPHQMDTYYISLLSQAKVLYNYPNIFNSNYQYLSRHLFDCPYKKALNDMYYNINNKNIKELANMLISGKKIDISTQPLPLLSICAELNSVTDMAFYKNLGHLLTDGPYDVLVNRCGIAKFEDIASSNDATVEYINKMFLLEKGVFDLLKSLAS